MQEKTIKPGTTDAERDEFEKLFGSKFLVRNKEDIAHTLATASPYDETELGRTPTGELIIQRADGMIVVRGPNGDKAPSYTVAGATGDYNGDGIRDTLQTFDFTPVLPVDIDGYKIDAKHGFGYKLDKDAHGGKVLHLRRYGKGRGRHGSDHEDDGQEDAHGAAHEADHEAQREHGRRRGPRVIDLSKHIDPKSEDGKLIADAREAAKDNAELRDAMKGKCKIVIEADAPGPPEIKAEAPAARPAVTRVPKPPGPN